MTKAERGKKWKIKGTKLRGPLWYSARKLRRGSVYQDADALNRIIHLISHSKHHQSARKSPIKQTHSPTAHLRLAPNRLVGLTDTSHWLSSDWWIRAAARPGAFTVITGGSLLPVCSNMEVVTFRRAFRSTHTAPPYLHLDGGILFNSFTNILAQRGW